MQSRLHRVGSDLLQKAGSRTHHPHRCIWAWSPKAGEEPRISWESKHLQHQWVGPSSLTGKQLQGEQWCPRRVHPCHLSQCVGQRDPSKTLDHVTPLTKPSTSSSSVSGNTSEEYMILPLATFWTILLLLATHLTAMLASLLKYARHILTIHSAFSGLFPLPGTHFPQISVWYTLYFLKSLF